MNAGVQQHFVGAGELGAEVVVLIEIELGEEGLVAQTAVGVVAAGVDVGAAFEQAQ
ncbi:hypothetical protein [Microbacterium lacticum]|uniref:hypothetical protein n=1 Tax=Microbacterium lacticum TaxID=33885 RepID=UPI001F511895|nr:hypothetical protein [Microbacterium lacticum]